MPAYQKLTDYVTKMTHLNWLDALSRWDEAVMMPSGAGSARAQALSTLNGFQHELATSKQLEDLILAAKQQPLDNAWDKANLALIEQQYAKATCLDQHLVEATTKASIEAEQAWRQLRSQNDWGHFYPILQRSFDLIKETNICLGQALNLSPFDAALDQYNRGIRSHFIDPIFSELKAALPNMIRSIIDKQKTQKIETPNGPFAIKKQQALAHQLMQLLCFDFNHGRLDESHHPFCGGIPDDVRATTRYDKNEFIQAAMAVCHETGHAKYEQQLPKAFRSQPVGQSHNMAIHESQSLFIEMQICRTQEFMHCLAPLLNSAFGDQPAFSESNLYALYNKVEPGYIRVEADEVTYPLHVIMRYEIEKALFNDDLTLKDLPHVWNAYMNDFFDLNTEGRDDIGVMQDVHWPCGAFGYFPAYTLGNLIAAQLKQRIRHDLPDLSTHIRTGNLQTIFTWLEAHIHSQGQLRDFHDSVKFATGSPLTAEAFLQHIKTKYQP